MKTTHQLIMGGSVEIDWSQAPEGATAYSAHPADSEACWIKNDGGRYFQWENGRWYSVLIEEESDIDVWHIDRPAAVA